MTSGTSRRTRCCRCSQPPLSPWPATHTSGIIRPTWICPRLPGSGQGGGGRSEAEAARRRRWPWAALPEINTLRAPLPPVRWPRAPRSQQAPPRQTTAPRRQPMAPPPGPPTSQPQPWAWGAPPSKRPSPTTHPHLQRRRCPSSAAPPHSRRKQRPHRQSIPQRRSQRQLRRQCRRRQRQQMGPASPPAPRPSCSRIRGPCRGPPPCHLRRRQQRPEATRHLPAGPRGRIPAQPSRMPRPRPSPRKSAHLGSRNTSVGRCRA
mmetsp:Transcript_54350/g.153968  ORF Transcript_54350/g.153968 Transcript_54350/m.153968 type:complete len:262 (-) Transcript_54350:875-1660(-)